MIPSPDDFTEIKTRARVGIKDWGTKKRRNKRCESL